MPPKNTSSSPAKEKTKVASPKRKTPTPVEGITHADVEEAFEKIVGPYMPGIMAFHVDEAFRDDKIGLATRVDLLDRYLGKPTQKLDVKEDRHIQVIIRGYEDEDPRTIIEGEVRSLEAPEGSEEAAPSPGIVPLLVLSEAEEEDEDE